MRIGLPLFLDFVPLRIIVLAAPECREPRFSSLNDSSTWLSTPNTVSLAYHLSSTPNHDGVSRTKALRHLCERSMESQRPGICLRRRRISMRSTRLTELGKPLGIKTLPFASACYPLEGVSE